MNPERGRHSPGLAHADMPALLLYAALACCVAAGEPADNSEPQRILETVQPVALKLRDTAGVTKESADVLKTARRAMLDYTKREAVNGKLNSRDWQWPFCTCYWWALRYELARHAEAHAAVREALDVLKAAAEQNAAVVAFAVSSIVMQYAEQWMDFNAVECVQLVDEIEEWVLKLPGGKKEWIVAFRFTQAGFISQEWQFKEQDRAWLWLSRQKRLKEYVEGNDLELRVRADVLRHWARTLYLMGHGQEALALVRDWDKRHGTETHDAEYLKLKMMLALFECADWEEAGRVLEHANSMKSEWQRKPSQQRAYEALCNLYFKNIGLMDYQLLRWREQEKKKPYRRRDSLPAVGG